MKDRILTLDLVRGLAIIFIIFFHSSIYNYDRIHQIDFSNPPIFIVLISFMALWGGIFIIYSSIVNTFVFLRREEQNENKNIVKILLFIFLIYILIHFFLNIVAGRWNVDFINNRPDLTFFAALLRGKMDQFDPYKKIFDGSSISTISFNIILLSFLQNMFKKFKFKRDLIYIFLLVAGFSIIFFSFIRVDIYRYFDLLKTNKVLFPSIILTFFVANPYPLITYFSYGLFGMLIGYLIFDKREDILKKLIIPTSLFLIFYGLYGISKFQKSISKPDLFWYFKTNFELGFFILSIILIYLLFERKKSFLKKLSFIYNFSRVSISIYMMETLFSEVLRKIFFKFNQTWNLDMNKTFFFGFFNVLLWIMIVNLWSKINFKYSVEYFWVKFFKMLGKDSTKLKT